MADAILAEILKMLGSTLFQEMELVWGIKDELAKLESTVSLISAVLEDAEEKQVKNKAIEHWLEKLNDALHEAGDVLDDFSTQALRLDRNRRLKKVRNFFLILNRLVSRCKLAHDIKAVNKILDAIAKERLNFQLTIQSTDHMRGEKFHLTKKEKTDPLVCAEIIIGREGDKLEIVELLLKNNVQENVSVVAIVGIGGLGKTALAQLVYNDDRVAKHFELQMWVCVSHDFDVKIIAKKIIESEKFDEKKFLLVLDDVWDDNHGKWIELIGLLMGGKRGSKILVTTRSESVAKASETNSPYFLKGLSQDESWSLFKTLAFRQGEESDNTFKIKIGKEIMQKCKGVPLAIRAIGSLLYFKDTVDEWLFFKNNNFSKIAEEEDVIFPILKFSYDDLPLHLKRCFAFCSLYLKDQTIDKEELIQLWIAEGFIRPMYENQLLEDVGDLYFMDLLRRSLFQDVERDNEGGGEGDIISCKMHDLVHDLAQLVARAKFFMINSNVNDITGRTRHVSLDSGANLSEKISNHLVRANKLRTFILKAQKVEVSNKLDLEKIVSTFRRLRVLDLHSMGIEIVPSYISKLKHLRYLDLSKNRCIKTLPSSITILINLQTLKLNGCSSLEELPRDFTRLVSLRHLELDNCKSLTGMPYGLGHLTSLLTLTLFVADSNRRLSELQSLNKLRERLKVVLRCRDSCGRLCLRTAEVYRIIEKDEESKEYLMSLALKFERDKNDGDFERDENEELLFEALRPDPNLKQLQIWNCQGASFPGWMMVDKIGLSLPNLVRIEISECNRWKHLPPFGLLPSLQFLSVDWMESLEYIDNSTGNGEECLSSLPSSSSGGAASAARRRDPTPTPTSTFFPSLKELRLCDLPNLKGWMMVDKIGLSLPNLVRIEIKRCKRWKHLPPFGQLPSLQFLTVRGMESLEYIDNSTGNGEECLSSLPSSSSGGAASAARRRDPTPTPTSTFFPSLKELRLCDLPNLKGWMMVDKIGLSLPNLVRIEIKRCKRWKHLPPFGQLPSLQFLTVRGMESLEYIDNSTGNGEECLSSLPSSSSGGAASAARRRDPTPTPTSTFFPSLKELRLFDLPNLKGWWRSEVEATETISSPTQQQHQLLSPSLLPSFPSLSTLYIQECPNLASVPLLPPCLETLTLSFVSVKLVMMMMVSPTISTTTTVATSSSSSSMLLPLSNLKFLYLRRIEFFWVPEEWFLSLTSLQKLDIFNSVELTYLSGGLRHLTALDSLSIEGCKRLDLLEYDDGMQFQGLKSLTYLKLLCLPRLVSLPVGLQHLTTLKHLHIQECQNLKALPEWIGNLPSLEELTIKSCWMLYDRCHKGTGEDWPKIARIPNVILKKYDWE